MKKIKISKIASCLKNINLSYQVEISQAPNLKEGDCLVVQALESQGVYGDLELVNGRMAKIYPGDLIASALGERKALEGIVGIVPQKVKSGDSLHILNLGGVIGKALSWNKDIVKKPISVKVIGAIVKKNKVINTHNFSLTKQLKFNSSAPLILVAGTAMNTGKTTVATKLVHLLSQKGFKVAAAKLTGVATQKDLLSILDAGAVKILGFADVGLTSTLNNHHGVIPASKTIINNLNKLKPDFIVVELGDGIVGWYGVDKLLKDKNFTNKIAFTIICANDLAGAKATINIFNQLSLKINFFAGPVTNNTAGTDYLEHFFKIPGQDLRESNTKLLKVFKQKGVL